MTIRSARRSGLLLTCVLLLMGCASTGDRPAEWVSGADPVYPPQAKARGVEGYVVVEYRVSETGAVMDAAVVESQPPGVFDQSALDAVRSWRYRPAVRSGEEVSEARVKSRLEFKLNRRAYEGY